MEAASVHGGAAHGTRPAPTTAAARATQRDACFDNAKYLAIVLVAMGHAWEPLRSGSRTVAALYTVVYAFHMPAFIIVSGYFSRGFDASPAKMGEVGATLAAGLVVTALCTAPVRRTFRFAVEPKLDWAFRGDPARAARDRTGAAA